MTTKLSASSAWQSLKAEAANVGQLNIAQLLASETGRLDRMMLKLDGALFDFSKNLVSEKTLRALFALAQQQDVAGWFARMMQGEIINHTEGRAVMHTALRDPNAPQEVRDCLAKMERMANAVRADKSITDVVHIGIGGSDLGPRMVCKALNGLHEGPRMHFVANVDPDDLDPVLMGLDPAKTVITVASKTFTTHETMLNLKAARMWLKGRDERVIAMTSNVKAAAEMGITEDRILPMWDWVGGRYSVCSSVGLPIAIGCGFDVFKQFLDGCNAADRHVRETPYERNIPVTMALLSVWYRSFLGMGSLALVPYSQRLSHLSDYMQQLGMESNGKRVDRDGQVVDYATAPVLFGQVGTNSQHAFFQMLHQGPDTIPVDFIGAKTPHGCPERHKVLIANMFAQSRALMLGRDGTPERVCPGNRPSTTILLPAINAYNLGLLLAVYEHKTAAEGFLWNLNSFDQFGVELGKQLAKELLAPPEVLAQNESLDFSTSKLNFHFYQPE
ncbi:MAG: glucose-6-phosphate isomerase [Alphaproteobacteria bacterium]|nr:glucose-6-phosphate isomerase [Alphaproteobacteria bacterium]